MTRGDVYRARLRSRCGHEQHGPRYVVIVQADELLGFSTILVAPTSRSVRPAHQSHADLARQVDFLHGRIDSVNGGIRNSFEVVPAPGAGNRLQEGARKHKHKPAPGPGA